MEIKLKLRLFSVNFTWHHTCQIKLDLHHYSCDFLVFQVTIPSGLVTST